MIYVIKTPGYTEEKGFFFLLKIGYTNDKNRERRLAGYSTHNPCFEVLYEIPKGTEDHEKRLHFKFKDLKFKKDSSLSEWFMCDQSIIDYFESRPTLEDISKLPIKQCREDKNFLETRRIIKREIRYIASSYEEIDSYFAKVYLSLGSSLNLDTFREYVSKDLSLSQEIKDNYLKVIERERTGVFTGNSEIDLRVSKVVAELKGIVNFLDRIKWLCESVDKDILPIVLEQLGKLDRARYYIEKLGPDKVKNTGYNVFYMNKAIDINGFFDIIPSLENLIYQDFHEGDKLTSAEIKERLRKIYEEAKYKATPKATDISKYFEVNEVSFYIEDLDNPGKKKKRRGFELLKKK